MGRGGGQRAINNLGFTCWDCPVKLTITLNFKEPKHVYETRMAFYNNITEIIYMPNREFYKSLEF